MDDSIESEDALQRKKLLTATGLEELSKEDLIRKVIQLQAHNVQLRNIIAKKVVPQRELSRKARSYDFNKCRKMHVFLRVLYLGWNYQGFVCQEDTNETIEHYLMKALMKCKLIQSRETCNYHRCGRTDKGVSSFGQVISLTVRAADCGQHPLPYCKMLNRLLPADIRAVAWRSVQSDASSRFDCKSRSYRYFFPKSNLNLDNMRSAAERLVGTHDFRNICKMDVGNGVTNFVRRIVDVSISFLDGQVDKLTSWSDLTLWKWLRGKTGNVKKKNQISFFVPSTKDDYQMCELSITSNAFLWHQVRAIVSLLLLVGQGLEEESVVSQLLDVKSNPRKPQYRLAGPQPLNLFKCQYDFDDWELDEDEIRRVVESLQKLWTEHTIQSLQVKVMLNELEPLIKGEINEHLSAIFQRESKNYKPLLARPKCRGLEDRVDHYKKKQKTV